MIKLIYKTIWNEKRSNIWILIELVLIFSILFFCSDFAYKRLNLYLEPVGFDIEHTYNVLLGQKETGSNKIENEQSLVIFQQMMENIKRHPSIESVCISNTAIPYDGSYMSNLLLVDSISTYPQQKFVSPEFFEVFKVKFLEGNNFTANHSITNNVVILGGTTNDMFDKTPLSKIDSVNSNKTLKKVIGYVNPVKRSDFDSYHIITYYPFTANDIDGWSTSISFRVKEDVDKGDYVETLKKDLASQLNIDPYFFLDIQPTSKNKEEYLADQYTDIKSIAAISAFLLINIFLGVIGTFWLRIQSRRSEIGLQMALGASRNKIKMFYSLEALSLLFIASIFGFIVATNVLATGIVENIGIDGLSSATMKDSDILQMIIDYLITFGILAIICLIGVWIPSSKASKISPALVLRSE